MQEESLYNEPMKLTKRIFFFCAVVFLLPSQALPAKTAQREDRARVFGAPGESAESFLSESGVLVPFWDEFSIVPVIRSRGEWLTRSKADRHAFFQEKYLPIPNTIWNFDRLRLSIKTFTWGRPGKSALFARYRVVNKSQEPVKGEIYFLIRPIRAGAVSSIEFSEEGQSLLVNEARAVLFPEAPDKAGFFKKRDGSVFQKMKRGEFSQIHSVKDAENTASGAWSYTFELQAGQGAAFGFILPLYPGEIDPSGLNYKEALLSARAFWRKKLTLPFVQIEDEEILREAGAQMASLLTLRDAPGIYDDAGETWTSETLEAAAAFRLYGLAQEAREDLEAVSARMDLSGEISARAGGEQIENPRVRSYRLQGKFVSSVETEYLYSKDKAWLSEKWNQVRAALDYLKKIRAYRLSEWYAAAPPREKRFHGLLPPSMDPARGDFRMLHRYEDNLWALKGFKAGQKIAAVLGEDSAWMGEEERSLRRALLASLENAGAEENVRFIPFAAEKSWMEPAPGVLAVWPAEESGYLPAETLRYHFQNIADIFRVSKNKEPQKADWFSDYSAVQAFLRRGDKKTALEMFQHQTEKIMFGNVLETAGFLKAFRDRFVLENQGRLILGAGIQPEWIHADQPCRVRRPTPYGEILYKIDRMKHGWKIHVSGSAKPENGFEFHAPSGSAKQIFNRLPADFQLLDS